jgi:predicted transcriptional regulator
MIQRKRAKIIVVRIDEETLDMLDALAHEQERTRSAMIRFLIRSAAARRTYVGQSNEHTSNNR